MKYTFYWLDGKKDVLEGTSVSNALNEAGYGQGALTALDFYASGENDEYEWDKESRKWIRKTQHFTEKDQNVLAKKPTDLWDTLSDTQRTLIDDFFNSLDNYITDRIYVVQNPEAGTSQDTHTELQNAIIRLLNGYNERGQR